jgi:hypothetical protein
MFNALLAQGHRKIDAVRVRFAAVLRSSRLVISDACKAYFGRFLFFTDKKVATLSARNPYEEIHVFCDPLMRGLVRSVALPQAFHSRTMVHFL